jgi:hypothetical protein
MKFSARLNLDNERDRVWYEIIRLERLVSEGEIKYRSSLRSHRRRYHFLCKMLRIHWFTCL